MYGTKWTEEDIKTLRRNYLDWRVTVKEIAEKLGRTEASVIGKARHIGIRRPIPTLSNEGWDDAWA